MCVTHAAFWGGDFTPDALGAAYARLETAVPVFFALSGFLLVRPWIRARAGGAPPDVRRYLVARAWRVVPGYWVVVTVVYLIYLWRPDGSPHGHGWVAYLRHLTFTQIYSVGYVHTGLTQMWSMCVEVAFYLALPLLGLWLMRTRRAWTVPAVMVAVSAAWLVLATATEIFGKTARSWPPAFAAAFAAGIVVALLVDRVRLPRLPLLLAAAVAYAVLLTPLAGPIDLRLPTPAQGVTKFLLEALIGGLLVAAFATGPSRALGSRPMVWLGSISYEFFLIHVIVMEFVVLDLFGWSLFEGSTWTIVAVTTAITIVLAWGLHVGVERFRAAVTQRPAAVGARGH
ncbi:peptidoglycan/LPS O-acetylase OafA/YrhL [Tsukamurella ocularis]|nr:peptidoglycan/LPS O-acetylase OafA/YrhL [Tsukamurella ocularis]MCS3787781.1 peptidoglycan/LPS O-acetylase OafA/YrhL [Tsukamurella ocularis]MCS3851075.1 peptidoglycan/LPS O-acetylase OafA/YrhL [Tsukamurella ocularis]